MSQINIPIIEALAIPSQKRIAVKLKPAAEKKVKQNHPWIFDQSINKISDSAKTGDVCIIYDNKKDKLIGIGLFDLNSVIRIKLIHAGKGVTIDENWFAEKLNIAFSKRESLYPKHTNAVRIIFGENDGFPGLIADLYDTTLVLKLYSAIWLPYLKIIVSKLIKTVNAKNVVLRLSRNVRDEIALHNLYDGQVIYGELEDPEITIYEYDVKFKVNVLKGHKTGFFLDHRHNRRFIGSVSKGKKVLDVFSYAGGFSTHAMKGGAREVTSIDISNQAIALSKENMALNGEFDNHIAIASDAFAALNKIEREHKKYDVIIIDPPSFANKIESIEKAKTSYRKLAELGIKLIAENGILLLASCSSRIDAETFFDLNRTLIQSSKYGFRELKTTYHDIDHPIGFKEGAYLKSIYFERIK